MIVNQKAIKVLIVDDSLFFRETLAKGLARQNNIEVVGTASNPDEAKFKIKQLKPDVLTLDVEMPRLNGIEFLKYIMSTDPMPVVMVSGVNINVFDTLAAGAVDFVKKPQVQQVETLNQFYEELAATIQTASKAKLKVKSRNDSQHSNKILFKQKGFKRNIIAIGASTGGTEAILEIIRNLPNNMPGIVITQHMPSGFTKMFAERLNKICQLQVKEAEDNDLIVPGKVFIAPGGMQMRVIRQGNQFRLRCSVGEKVSGHCPSVDVLFKSVADNFKEDAIGVILTGMGNDGAKGLLEMKNKGAYTIGQDEQSCVVYGMPMVANNIGAVTKQASISNIAREIMLHL